MASLLTGLERRRTSRGSAGCLGFAVAGLLRPGVVVAVVELSPRGALVECAAAVRPGARTELGLDALDGRRHAVRACVLRCWVSELEPLRYRCVVCFDDALALG